MNDHILSYPEEHVFDFRNLRPVDMFAHLQEHFDSAAADVRIFPTLGINDLTDLHYHIHEEEEKYGVE